MKKLLQSRKFRKNLGKWIFMYVICMGLFTTVVTYSKYISKMLSSNDEARVSKFNVKLRYCENENCENGGTDNYITKNYRPTSEIVYYFSVDASDLEVNADLLLTIRINSHFKLKEIIEITQGENKPVNNISKNSGDTMSITTSVNAGSKTLKKYKVVVKYDESVIEYNKNNCTGLTNGCKIVNGVDNSSNPPKYIFDETKIYNILEIGYSIKQTK